ncbi:zinc ABC transporter substrate-binding protein ZnuA [Oceaniserpentilla sp. 4NH20-0058]|uniref:metal ABC transporter solute-binding protein, Zn/Mn family n=1 Tax=Oceaniserpentilla sp. 4NH20-0058 TaxID=3127660 RepID=UPI0031099C39
MQGFTAWIMALALMVMAINTQAQSSKPDTPSVLVSIHPIAMLIKSAWPDLHVTTLMKPNQSPHDFALKPSHRRLVAQSQHVIWLGDEMEPYLTKLVAGHTSALDLSGLFELAEEANDHHDGHNHGEHDPHIWLNPNAISSILNMVQQQLSLQEPNAFLQQLAQWQLKAKTQLEGLDAGFISFHDAFHYWINYFALNQVAALALNPEQPIGTRHLVKVRQILSDGKATCLFIEPQFKASIVKKLQQGTNVPVVDIDPIGSQFNVNDGKFFAFYDYLLMQFQTCLKAK